MIDDNNYLEDLINRRFILIDRLDKTIEVSEDRELLKRRYDEFKRINNLIIDHYSSLLLEELQKNLILLEITGY